VKLLPYLGSFAADRLLPAGLTLFLGMLAVQLLLRLLTLALAKSRLEKAAHSLIRSVARVGLYGLLGLTVASGLGIDVTGVVALASVLTLAVSLALQNALSNTVGGFTLLSTKPFVSGDFVEIAGQSGTVQEIGLTYTKLSTPDNKTVSIPNSAVVAAQIVNYTAGGTRRVEICVRVAFSVSAQQVLQALLQAAQVDTVLDSPAPKAAVSSFGESSVCYALYVWCRACDYFPTLFAVNQNIPAVFDAMGIQMAYPHLNVHLEKDS